MMHKSENKSEQTLFNLKDVGYKAIKQENGHMYFIGRNDRGTYELVMQHQIMRTGAKTGSLPFLQAQKNRLLYKDMYVCFCVPISREMTEQKILSAISTVESYFSNFMAIGYPPELSKDFFNGKLYKICENNILKPTYKPKPKFGA